MKMMNLGKEKLNNAIVFVIILSFAIVSCSPKEYSDNFTFSHKEYMDRRTANYKFLYVVDTVSIESPIAFTHRGHWYVCADTIIKNCNYKIDDSFYTRTDIFLYAQHYLFMLTFNDPFFDFKKYSHEYKEVETEERIYYKNFTLYAIRFNKPKVRFLMGLINHDFYEYCVRCPDYPYKRIENKNPQNTFFKILTCY